MIFSDFMIFAQNKNQVSYHQIKTVLSDTQMKIREDLKTFFCLKIRRSEPQDPDPTLFANAGSGSVYNKYGSNTMFFSYKIYGQ